MADANPAPRPNRMHAIARGDRGSGPFPNARLRNIAGILESRLRGTRKEGFLAAKAKGPAIAGGPFILLAPRPGLEPGTYGLTVRRSTN